MSISGQIGLAAWQHEARGPEGEWIRGAADAAPRITPFVDMLDWPGDLAKPEEYQAVNDYLSPAGCHAINSPLHHGSIAPEKPPAGEMTWTFPPLDYHKDTIVLDRLIAEHTTTAPAVLYRGFAMDAATERQLKPGAVFTDNGFTSATNSRDLAQSFAQLRTTGTGKGLSSAGSKPVGGKPALMKLNLPAGTHMIPGETQVGEYVLARGGRYRVDSVAADGTYEMSPLP